MSETLYFENKNEVITYGMLVTCHLAVPRAVRNSLVNSSKFSTINLALLSLNHALYVDSNLTFKIEET